MASAHQRAASQDAATVSTAAGATFSAGYPASTAGGVGADNGGVGVGGTGMPSMNGATEAFRDAWLKGKQEKEGREREQR